VQFPITIGLHRSRLIDLCLLFVALLASLATLGFPQTVTSIKPGVFATIWIAAALAWWQLSPKIAVVRLERSGQVFIDRNGRSEFLPAKILPGATVHPWMTVVRLKTEDGCSSQLIATVDSLNQQDFRHLRVFLRWQADFSEPNDAA